MKNDHIESEVSFMEPVLNSGDPKWLIVTTQKIFPEPKKRPTKEALTDPNPVEPDIKHVFTTQEQGLWKCRKCGAKILSTPGKPEICDEDQGGCNRATTFDPLYPIINTDLWKLPKWEDIPSDDIDMPGLYLDTLELVKKCIIFVDEIYYKIFVLWIFSTWKFECWESVGWPLFLGLIDSGKSRGLDIIRELGWRMLPSTGITMPAMVRASHYFNAGICLDEIQHKLNTRTEKGQDFVDFVKPGYRRGSKYIVADKEDQTKIISYDNFSFKAFAGEKMYEEAILSRCILFEMEKDNPEVQQLSEVQIDFDKIQTKLLNFRFKLGDPAPLPDDCPLLGRTREIFQTIVRTGLHIGVDVTDIYEFAKEREEERDEEFRNTIQYDVLNAIHNFQCNGTLDDSPEHIKISDLMEIIGWDGKTKGRTSQSLGYVLKSLGLKKHHTRDGKVILLNEAKTSRKLRYLFKRYKVLEGL